MRYRLVADSTIQPSPSLCNDAVLLSYISTHMLCSSSLDFTALLPLAWVQAKERLRIATEKLYQQEVDAEIMLEQMKEDITNQMDRSLPLTPSVEATCNSCAIFVTSICGSMLECFLFPFRSLSGASCIAAAKKLWNAKVDCG